MRKFTVDRWNWSERAGKWVYVELILGKRAYTYKLEPPQQFVELTTQLKDLNDKLMTITDVDENNRLFKHLMKLTQKMQKMRDGNV